MQSGTQTSARGYDLRSLPGALHSVLDPAGPQAGRIGTLWWFLLAVAVAVFVAFTVALFVGLWRGSRRSADGPPDAAPSPASERAAARAVSIAVAATVVILLSFTVVSYLTGQRIGTIDEPQPLTVSVTAHQWWWDVEYEDSLPERRLRTANEIHIPIGRPVLLRLRSSDVIHSFWVPSLHGKRDLTPGYVSFTWLQADRPGIYRGQCAEFCGHAHAKMALLVVAVPEAEYARWYDEQLLTPGAPADSDAAAGQRVFMARGCALCHAIAGTEARARTGPDLSRIGSRRTLAAGTIPNTPGSLAGWIVDPQRVKPGARMPPQTVPPAELRALVHYLSSLR